jgi:hypothetical protein
LCVECPWKVSIERVNQLTAAALLEGFDGVNGCDDEISEGCGEEASDRHRWAQSKPDW